MSDELVKFVSAYCDDLTKAKTDRGRHNLKYFFDGLDALDIRPKGAGLVEFCWLIDWSAADRHRKGAVKIGIIAELGRFAAAVGVDDGSELARKLGREICRWRLTSVLRPGTFFAPPISKAG